MRIRFIHTCHVDCVRYDEGTEVDVDEAKLPANWVTDALREEFVERVIDAKPSDLTKVPSGFDPHQAESAAVAGVPADVQAKLAAFINP